MRILAFSSDKVASSWQRILLPFHWMHKLGIAEIRWGERETDDAFTWSDICVFQRWYAGRTHHWFRTMRLYGVRLVYELDDDCWRIERDNPFQSFYAREQLDAMEDMVRAAALVTVPSRGLAEAMARWNRNVAVIPNGVDPGAFDLPVARRAGEVRLGFAGSRTHDRDFAPLLAALPRVLRRHPQARLVVVGDPPTRLAPMLRAERLMDRATFTGWVKWEGDPERGEPGLYETLAAHGIDVCLVPLRESQFNRGKSNIKWVEASATGACTAAADVGIYAETIRDGVNGRLVAGNGEVRWQRVLEELVEDAPQRERLWRAARAEVRGRYAYDRLAYEWAAALRGVVPTDGGKNARVV